MPDKFKKLINSDFSKISQDILEIPLDNFIDNEILNKIPIFSTIVNLYNLGSTISDKIFANKLIHFLKELEDINPNTIQKEIQYIDDSNEYKHKVGEKILEIINRIDSEEKPKIIGRLFKNFILKKINYVEFLKLSYIVENIFYFDLKKLNNFFEIKYPISTDNFVKKYINIKDCSIELVSFGLCENMNHNQPHTLEFIHKNNIITKLGEKLIDCGLKEK